MQLVNDILRDRKNEIESHIELLKKYEERLLNPSPNIDQVQNIAPVQFSVLKSCTYLLIYNMIEAVVVNTVKEIENIISEYDNAPRLLTDKIKLEWVQYCVKDIKNAKDETINKTILYLLECLKNDSNFKLKIKLGGGGNWSNKEIVELSNRLGVDISSIPREINSAILYEKYSGKGCIEYVVKLRNQLAHGEVSFSECSKDQSAENINEIFENTSKYLEEVIKCFTFFIDNHLYIKTDL